MAGFSSERRKKLQGRSSKLGLAPGTMVFIGEQKIESASVNVINYSDKNLNELHDVPHDQCCELIEASGVTWIDVTGIHDMKLIEGLGKCLKLHPLTLEDIVNTIQRPKTEEFSDYIYAVLKTISFDEEEDRLEIEQVSMILGENYLVSFQEKDGNVFNPVRQRLRTAKGRIRSMKADYLAYALMDAVVDHYFLTLERFGDRVESLEDQILGTSNPDSMHDLHRLKRDILRLRKAVWPLREEIGALLKSDSELIRPETRVFLRDLYDHTIQVIDMVETFRDVLGGMHDSFLSSVSNRMNEIMKVLTIIATIFIPLTFIAGVYGMNFEHMPELKWHYGYFLVLGVMFSAAIGLLGYFKIKKWI